MQSILEYISHDCCQEKKSVSYLKSCLAMDCGLRRENNHTELHDLQWALPPRVLWACEVTVR